MVKVSLSGNVWLEDVPGCDFVLETPPKSVAYYQDNSESLPVLRGGSDDPECEVGSSFSIERSDVIIVGLADCGSLEAIRIRLVSPKELLLLDDVEDRWLIVGASRSPNTIDRRRTIWQRLKSDE